MLTSVISLFAVSSAPARGATPTPNAVVNGKTDLRPPDGYHYSGAGYEVLGKAVTKAICNALQPGPHSVQRLAKIGDRHVLHQPAER